MCPSEFHFEVLRSDTSSIRKAMGYATLHSNRVWDCAMAAGGASVLLVGVENAVVPLCAGSDWWHHVFDGLPWASTAGAPGPSPPQPLQSKQHQRVSCAQPPVSLGRKRRSVLPHTAHAKAKRLGGGNLSQWGRHSRRLPSYIFRPDHLHSINSQSQYQESG